MNKLIITIILGLAIAVTIPSVYAVVDGQLFGIEGGCCVTPPPRIHDINKTDTGIDTGQTISRLELNVNITGSTINGVQSMSVDPTTGIFYGIARHTANATDRHLISFDPLTGIGSDIGGMGDKFQSLGFKSDGSLRAVTGSVDGTPNPYQLHSVDKTTGITTFLCQFPTPTGSFKEAGKLAFNFQDGFMYHIVGQTNIVQMENNTKLGKITSESNSPTFCGESTIVPSNANGFFTDVGDFSVTGFTYSIEENLFYGASLGGKGFWKMTLSGVATEIRQPSGGGTYNTAFDLLNPQGNEIKGLAFDVSITPVKRSSANPSSAFPAPDRGGQQSISQLSDVKPLTQPAPPDVDRAISLFDQLNSLFDFRPAEPAPAIPDLPDAVPDQRPSFVDAIRDFFRSLFG